MGVKPSDDRVPDPIGVAQYGVVWAGSKQSKIAGHGGNAKQDRDVVIVVWGSSVRHRSNDESVETTQIAPTIAAFLGLDPNELQAVPIEHTRALPSVVE
jgi:predicted AlkP superfamily pyrophosphatase or phosphodiesterase